MAAGNHRPNELAVASAQQFRARPSAKSPVMLPIPGTSAVAHVEENIAAARLKLGAEDLAKLG